MASVTITRKESIRSVLRARRAALNAATVTAAMEVITARTLEYLTKLPHSEWVFAYAEGRGNEVPTLDLLDGLVIKGHTVLLPIPLPGEDRQMRWARYNGRDKLLPGIHGIPQPHADGIISESLPVSAPVLVPGVAFDASGTRLGFGAGYYDRFLAEHEGVRIAPAYDFQVVDDIPREGHDIPMDVIITEMRVIQCRASNKG
jgi:5-formyltetrahydrofolate cyclo-ligase